jgi:hypothetical protein
MNKRAEKIYKKIDSIAKKGLLGRSDYFTYVDNLLKEGSYSVFQDVLIKKYGIDTIYISTIDEVKRRTFDLIRFQTSSKFQDDIKSLYELYDVIHIGQSIIRRHDGLKIGYIVEGDNSILRVFRNDLYSIYVDDLSLTLVERYSSAIQFLLATNVSTYADDVYAENYFY